MRWDTLVKGTEFQAETLPAKQAKGAVKAVGEVVGRRPAARPKKADNAEGKLQNAVGGLKNAIRKVEESAGKREAPHHCTVWVVAYSGFAIGRSLPRWRPRPLTQRP